MKVLRYFAFCAVSVLLVSCGKDTREPVDWVNPYIGNISHMLVPTYPTVQLPNSMLRIYPERADYTSEYLNGLPLIVTNHRERSAFKLSVTTGEVRSAVTPLSYENERLTPFSYSVTLADGEIDARFAVSRQSAMYEFVSDKHLRLALASLKGSVGTDDEGVFGTQAVLGSTKVYFYLQTQQTPSSVEAPDSSYVVLGFDENRVRLRYGVSFISCEQARANLQRELKDYDIDALEKEGRRIWNETLSRFRIKGGTDDERTVFYTSCYRTFERPV